MKKNFLTAAALMVAGFFVATEVAIAADVSFSGQVRTRYEANEQGINATNTDRNFTSGVDANDSISTRMRLNANVKVNDSTSAFIQMQSNRNWGNDLDTSTNNVFGGSGNASFTPSDGDASVGIHQAYFTLKNFAGAGVDAKVGKQEIVLDGHRLFGHTGWTTGANAHDAIRLTHKHGNNSLDYIFIVAGADGRAAVTDVGDVEVHVLRANFQGILGGNLTLMGVANVDGCGSITANQCAGRDNNIYTFGFRQAGQLFGIDYRGEYYHQSGDATADSQLIQAQGTLAFDYTLAGGSTDSVDRDASMFGVRIGKKFNNVAMKPSLTLWYDQLSGTDDSDLASSDYGTFNTLFDTGHKFYGHMDLFLSNINHGTQGLGLIDIAVKGSIQPMPGWTVKAAMHWFKTDTDPGANLFTATNEISSAIDDDLGTELDLVIINKYNANTTLSVGWSQFAADRLFMLQTAFETAAANVNTANWVYVQADVKF